MWQNMKEGYLTKTIECKGITVRIHRPENLSDNERAKREKPVHQALKGLASFQRRETA